MAATWATALLGRVGCAPTHPQHTHMHTLAFAPALQSREVDVGMSDEQIRKLAALRKEARSPSLGSDNIVQVGPPSVVLLHHFAGSAGEPMLHAAGDRPCDAQLMPALHGV